MFIVVERRRAAAMVRSQFHHLVRRVPHNMSMLEPGTSPPLTALLANGRRARVGALAGTCHHEPLSFGLGRPGRSPLQPLRPRGGAGHCAARLDPGPILFSFFFQFPEFIIHLNIPKIHLNF
jgi:hypothetical protein